mmetsp:Transcript_5900/g.10122  ORF Transcript_5900/g.10122 Transcript_5900/m.10122 type:complete len:573 (-) Transcript_5900:108-1826(-)|eukprot:CAMPEP_0196661860 /NCGR_PEP_ID=MMETSP1086-20130531/46142_1 /TAXON_ID=77921 /ORGANISM="Cyanoptyche  gloeocystis , Strain SAG4.97" /LENGTH=572 /DNA_ID=CAMNT_0041996955 /DNA_START=86 /DNA_END=1804 /DNA_ORIENTATION=+
MESVDSLDFGWLSLMSLRNARVLVVDDDSFTRKILQSSFQRFTLKVSAAESGKHALEMLKKAHYDILLIDVLMPDMTGFQVLQLERENESFNSTAVIMMSSYADIETVVNSFRIGADDFLPKPISFKELKNRAGANLLSKQFRQQVRSNLHYERKYFLSVPSGCPADERFIAQCRPQMQVERAAAALIASFAKDADCAAASSSSSSSVSVKRSKPKVDTVSIDVDAYLNFQHTCMITDSHLPEGFPVVCVVVQDEEATPGPADSMMQDIEEDPFAFLPDEVLSRILVFLGKDALVSGGVCKRWRKICQDESVWEYLWTLISPRDLKSWKCVPAKYQQRIINYCDFEDLMDGPQLPDTDVNWEFLCRNRFLKSWCSEKLRFQSWKNLFLKLLVSVPSRRREVGDRVGVVVVTADGRSIQKQIDIALAPRPYEVGSQEYATLLASLRPLVSTHLDLDIVFLERPDTTVFAFYCETEMHAADVHSQAHAGVHGGIHGVVFGPTAPAAAPMHSHALNHPLQLFVSKPLDEGVSSAFGDVLFLATDNAGYPIEYSVDDFLADVVRCAAGGINTRPRF